MNRRFGRLPPMSALEGFEAAARLKSFSLAADELNLSQSAVSHQIKALEEFFGLPLFNRVGRTVELTVAGMDFLDTVSEVLEELSRGKRRMDFYFKPGSVVFGCNSGFANRWLIPRYPLLKQWQPEIEPWFYTSEEVFELHAQEVDLAIWFGDGKWPGVQCEKLFHDYLTPLYASDLFNESQQITQISDLDQHTLLHDERSEDWLHWFNHVGHQAPEATTGASFSDHGLSLECASRGMGVTLGSLVLGQELIETGKLQQPLDQVVKTQHAFYLVEPEQQRLRPAVAKAKEWLVQQARQVEAEIEAKLTFS
mgnify:FL=1